MNKNIWKILPALLTLYILLAAPANTSAQDWAITNITTQQRVDLRDLGYPLVNEIPENSSAITSLLTASNAKIYGGTSGDDAYLFVFDPALNKVKHLGKIPGQKGIHHSLAEGRDGLIYIGTGLNQFGEVKLNNRGDENIAEGLWKDIKDHFAGYPGGHLYRFDPRNDRKVKLPDMNCDLEDLGIPVPGNSVYALKMSPIKNEAYGLSYPDGHFFIYDIALKKVTDMGPVDRENVFHGPERYWRSLPRDLVCDSLGRVFMTGTDGFIQYYSPDARKIIVTELKVPGDYNYIQFFTDHAVADYFTTGKDGLIYGGSSDGYLFSLDPYKMKVSNLGKVRSARRIRCISAAKNGYIYIMAGEISASAPCQFYCYDPSRHSYEDLGLLIVDRSPYYYWRGQQFDSMTTGKDGTLYIGESERRSHLFIYIPSN